MARKVKVVPFTTNWARRYREAAEELCALLGDELLAVEHIGSTAIPNMSAKPIIDILVVVRNIEAVDAFNPAFEAAGYLPRGEYGIPGRRFFIRGSENQRTRHVHIFQQGSPQIERHLAFRDYMITHPEEAAAYAQLKETLAQRFPQDIDGYIAGKDAFIKEIDRRAAAWRAHPAQPAAVESAEHPAEPLELEGRRRRVAALALSGALLSLLILLVYRLFARRRCC